MAAAQALRPTYGRRSTGAGHKLTLGFDPIQPAPLYEEKELARQGRTMNFVENSLGATDLKVERVGSRAILRGTVPSAERARVAEKLALLEPGIYDVDNQLRVVPDQPR